MYIAVPVNDISMLTPSGSSPLGSYEVSCHVCWNAFEASAAIVTPH